MDSSALVAGALFLAQPVTSSVGRDKRQYEF